MKKIPTVFERDWDGDRSRVIDKVHAGCEWVLAGEGIATRKLDGTCCMVRANKLYKRREFRKGESVPSDFEQTGHDEETGKTVGWVPVGYGPDDRWHREAFGRCPSFAGPGDSGWPDGSYELIGPKVQGNPENWRDHQLVRHGSVEVHIVPRTFDGLKEWLANKDMEGIVFHHPDGRMAKIKLRDFGLRRGSP